MIREKIKKNRISNPRVRYFYISLCFASILLLFAVKISETRAETVKLFFQNILQFETSVGVEDNSEMVLMQYDLRWNDFENELPLETEVTSISLHFLVSTDVEDLDTATEEVVSSSTQTSFSEEENTVEAATTTFTSPEVSDEVLVGNGSAPSEVTVTSAPDDLSPVFAENSSEAMLSSAEVVQEANSDMVTENTDPVPDASSITDNAIQTLPESDMGTYQVESYTDEVPLEDRYTTEVLPLEVISTETLASTSQVSEATTSFEVLYSIDGNNWQSLGRGDLHTNQNVLFDLSEIATTDIGHLEVAIQYVATETTHKNTHFSQMRLEIECVLPEVIQPLTPDSPVDLEPNFEISAIKADVQNENIRSVLIERGGMLELWYGVLQEGTNEAIWQQLAADGSLSATSPLQIHGRTIFWLDKNQQTLFGFSIDAQSLFGDSLMSDNENSLSLTFSSENSEPWSVHYDPVSNLFEFTRER